MERILVDQFFFQKTKFKKWKELRYHWINFFENSSSNAWVLDKTVWEQV